MLPYLLWSDVSGNDDSAVRQGDDYSTRRTIIPAKVEV